MSLEGVKKGDRVCIAGRGTANIVHAHAEVERLTKTMIIVSYMPKGRSPLLPPIERRYRFTGREVGASEYGGTHLDVKCQRKKKS